MAEHDKLTKQEAGRKGGEVRAEKYNKEGLSEQAKKAADTIEQKHPGFHSEIGKKGGQTRAAEYTSEELSEQAKKAADTIEQKHSGLHSEIGKKGGANTGSYDKELDDDQYEPDEYEDG